MLLANEVVALELKRRNRPGLYRIHENSRPGPPAGIPRAGQVDGFSLRRPDAAGRNPEAAQSRARASRAKAWSRSACSSRSSAPCTAPSRWAITASSKHELHPLHLAHPALFGPGRASRLVRPPARRRAIQLRRSLAAGAASFQHRTRGGRGRAGIGEAQEARIFRPAGPCDQAHVVSGAHPGSALLGTARPVAGVRHSGHGAVVRPCREISLFSTRNGWSCRGSVPRLSYAPGRRCRSRWHG